jgi:hypothetical protein
MPGIYLAALLGTAVAAAIFGPLIHKLRLPANERMLWLAAALALPLQPLVFFCVRIPLDHWLATHLDSTSATYRWLITFYAPLTEETAKLIPLLIPAVCHDIRRENFLRYALAIGVGFALGEMWFVANRISHLPTLAALPFYQFGGFLSERLMVCVFHTAFLSVSLRCLSGAANRSGDVPVGFDRGGHGRRRQALALGLGLAGAIALHWLGNFPLSLRVWNVGGLGPEKWAFIVQGWLLFYFLLALALLFFSAYGHKLSPGRMFFGRRHCPGCAQDYDAPLFAVNMGASRYERCPHCRRWHWTKAMPGAK